MKSEAVHPSLRSLPPAPFTERVTFFSAFEGLFLKAYANQLNATIRAELKAVGLDLDKPVVAYPQAVFVSSLDVASRQWFPGEPASATYFKLGMRNIEGFFETFLGTPMLALLRLLGPKRTLARMQKNFRSANNYTETVLVELGENRFQMWVNEPKDMRHFMHGVMQRGVQLAGAEPVRFDVLEVDDEGTVFDITL